MKHLRFVLAPKVAMILFATILIPFVQMSAQANPFAFNSKKFVHEEPLPIEKRAFSISIAQLDKDSLHFQLSVENPDNEKLTLYIKDSFNNTLHREVLPATVKFEARYNLQSLEDGEYIFEVRSGKNKLGEKAIGIKTQTQVNRMVSVEK
ncbi:hypothetical protein [Chitinophaga solisilvae]|uniref:Uncharacterized protein n=1 Tax=Chitinophaga solisilvae TaxID=1233460 RepID=A0A9Q5DAE9_9BACT|nr:hypothetical protein [Chitinophaga solisilvae]NSL89530.1 hypothetical protein [Chitinophaga solisilvae]